MAWTASARGAGAVAAMVIIGRFTQLVDNRLLIAVGCGATAAATFIFGSVDLEIARGSLFLPNVLSGIGIV